MLDIAKLQKSLILPFESEAELLQSVQELWSVFNQKRDQLAQYPLSEKLVSAYTMFYLPTNFYRLHKAFEKLGSVTHDFLECDFYDIGSGPATFSLAFLDYFPNFNKNLFVIDQSHLMRKQAGLLLDQFHPVRENIFISESLATTHIEAKNKKIFFFGHSFNEMNFETFSQIIQNYEPDFILLLEPGTHEVFHKVLAARDFILGENYEVLFPCASSSHCPMKGSSNWCHQYLTIRQEPEIERLCQILKIDRRNNPVTLHLYSKKTYSMTNADRIVGTYEPLKFGFKFTVCRKNKNKLEINDVEFLSRNLTKEQMNYLKSKQNGDEILFEVEKSIGSGALRGKLSD
jgi:hypothetical protein